MWKRAKRKCLRDLSFQKSHKLHKSVRQTAFLSLNLELLFLVPVARSLVRSLNRSMCVSVCVRSLNRTVCASVSVNVSFWVCVCVCKCGRVGVHGWVCVCACVCDTEAALLEVIAEVHACLSATVHACSMGIVHAHYCGSDHV